MLKTISSTRQVLRVFVFSLISLSEQLFDRKVDFAAAPDVFPPDRFNAGVMVVAPSQEVLEDMLSKVSELPSYDGGDTGKQKGIPSPDSYPRMFFTRFFLSVCLPFLSHKTCRPKPWNPTREEGNTDNQSWISFSETPKRRFVLV